MEKCPSTACQFYRSPLRVKLSAEVSNRPQPYWFDCTAEKYPRSIGRHSADSFEHSGHSGFLSASHLLFAPCSSPSVNTTCHRNVRYLIAACRLPPYAFPNQPLSTVPQ